MATEVAERDEESRRRVGPVTFAKEVRAESRKVTWTSRQETLLYTIFTLALVVLAALFFFATDFVVGNLVNIVLSLSKGG